MVKPVVTACLALTLGSAGCGLAPSPVPPDRQAIQADLSNIEGAYSNTPDDHGPDTLWNRVAPNSRMAHWSMPRDLVSLDTLDGHTVRFRLLRAGRVLDESHSRFRRQTRLLTLESHAKASGVIPLDVSIRTDQTSLSLDDGGSLRTATTVTKVSSILVLFGGRSDEVFDNRYERMGDLTDSP